MIRYIKGNIFESEAEALVNTVNLEGIMGKGIALQFKQHFPLNFKLYKQACKNHDIAIGKLFTVREQSVFGEKIVINFPTKTTWRKTSEYSYIEAGLHDLIKVIDRYNIKSIAIPPLGAGNGGLDWATIKNMIVQQLSDLPIDIYIYEPDAHIKTIMKQERVKLTDARALLLYVLFDLVSHGEDVSEFSSEKICYFLQKFGAKSIFNLTYRPKYYGPYSGKVRYVLRYLSGSYLIGYSDMNKKPFDSIYLINDTFDEVRTYIDNNKGLKEIAEKTKRFLNGFYSEFALELLSSVDFILEEDNSLDVGQVCERLQQWSDRKGKLFNNKKYVELAYNHIKENEPQFISLT